jgi:hypothetical protein
VSQAGTLLVALLLLLALPREPAPPGASPGRFEGPAGLLFGQRLDLNQARTDWLEVLPGVGPARAAAIVASRPFCRVEELVRVPGIGPRILEDVRPWIETHCDRP